MFRRPQACNQYNFNLQLTSDRAKCCWISDAEISPQTFASRSSPLSKHLSTASRRHFQAHVGSRRLDALQTSAYSPALLIPELKNDAN